MENGKLFQDYHFYFSLSEVKGDNSQVLPRLYPLQDLVVVATLFSPENKMYFFMGYVYTSKGDHFFF